MDTCPYCHQDPGDGARCEHCGEMLYRYATEPIDPPDEPPTDAPPASTPPPPPRRPDPSVDAFGSDPFSDPAVPSRGETGRGPRLGVPATPPPSPPEYHSPGDGATGPSQPGTYAPKQASGGGRGCVVAAIVVGALLVLGLVGLFLAGRSVFDDVLTNLDEGGFSASGDEINWEQVGVGDCIDFVDPITQGDDTTLVSTLERIPCTAPHDAEVYRLQDLPGTTWPGYESVYSRGDDICYDAFAPYVGIDYIDSLYFYEVYTPSPDSWDQGDRTVVCTLIDVDGKLDKPLRDARE